jgi:nitric oxide reductase subunit C
LTPFLVAFACALTACQGAPPEPTPTLNPLIGQGQQLFRQNCASCHALTPETIIVGPSLAGVASRAPARMPELEAEQYVALSILKPDAYVVDGFSDVMPKDFGKKLTGEELDALVAFLLTLE